MSEHERPSAWLSRPVRGLSTIGALVLLLAVPIGLVRELIGERLATRSEAVAEVTASWGGAQRVVGPRLVVPYAGSDVGPDGGVLNLLPAELEVDGVIRAEDLSRGLFSVPVYSARVELRGSFDTRDLEAIPVGGGSLAWDAATLVVGVGHVNALGPGTRLAWQGSHVRLEPGAHGAEPGIHAAVAIERGLTQRFEITLDLRGTESLHFAPLGRDTEVAVTSDWPHPSFVGAALPVTRSVVDDGFEATWSVPSLGRDYPQAWDGAGDRSAAIEASAFGVVLSAPVDHYRMAERSTKYAPLVLLMVFGLLWLFDTLIGIRLHVVQYVLVGAAMCLFYLLELSLSEVVGFTAAYTVASASVAGLIAAYTMAVLRSAARGAMVGGSLGMLYAYVLALLSLERYALLAGSLGLFASLAAVMYATRWVDWDAVARSGRPAES